MTELNALSTFAHKATGSSIRVVEVDGEPWFLTVDVCHALGILNATTVTDALAADEVRTVSRSSIGKTSISFPNRGARCISESGLYRLIMRANSCNPAARKFRDWVTRDVLPAIDKDGAYIMGEEKVRKGEMSEDEFVLNAITILKNKVERLNAERSGAERRGS